MRFRTPTFVAITLAIPLTWYLARRDLTEVCFHPRHATSQAAPVEALSPPAATHQPLTLLQDTTTLALQPGTHSVESVVTRWAQLMGLASNVDAQIRQTSLEIPERQVLTRTMLRELLDARDVVLVVRDEVLHAVHRRNLAQLFGPPWAIVGDAPVDPDKLVTRTLTVKHGAGSGVFATVRGLLTRDTNRIGNILYVQGPEKLILVDFAHKIRYYEEVIATLDTPPAEAASARVEAYEVPLEQWLAIQDSPAHMQVDALRADEPLDLVDVELHQQGASIERVVAAPSGATLKIEAHRETVGFGGTELLSIKAVVTHGDAEPSSVTIPVHVVLGGQPWVQPCGVVSGEDGKTVLLVVTEPRR